MAPALADSARFVVAEARGAPGARGGLKRGDDMEQILGELAQADLLQAIKTMEGGALADAMFPLGGFEPERDGAGDFLAEAGGEGGEAGGERADERRAALARRLAFLRRRLRMQQARALGKRAAETAGAAWARAGAEAGGARQLLRRLESAAMAPAAAAAAAPCAAPPGLERAAASLRAHLALVGSRLDSDATATSSGAESDDEPVAYNNPYQQPLPLSQRALWRWAKERASIASKWSWLQIQIHELEYKIQQHTELHKQMRASESAQEVGGYSGRLPGAAEAGEEAGGEAGGCARARPAAASRRRRLLQLLGLHNASRRAARPAEALCACAWPRAGCAVCTGRALPRRPRTAPARSLGARGRLARADPAFHAALSDAGEASASVRAAGLLREPRWQADALRAARRHRRGRPPPSAPHPPGAPHPHAQTHPHPHRRKHKHKKSKRGRPPLGPPRRAWEGEGGREAREGEESGEESPGPSLVRAARPRLNSSFDIDNIVIPHSVAANTRVEILHYKEIITPKWRVLDGTTAETVPGNNGLLKRKDSEKTHSEYGSDEEDISDKRLLERHQKCEQLERGKYRVLNASGSRRHHPSQPGTSITHSPEGLEEVIIDTQDEIMHTEPMENNIDRIMTSAENTSEPMEHQDNNVSAAEDAPLPSLTPIVKRRPTVQMDVQENSETVRPFSPRAFPLSEEAYARMLAAMPEDHPLRGPTEPRGPSPGPSGPSAAPSPGPPGARDDSEGSEAAAPPAARDDPDDPEWAARDARLDKLHRR